MGIALGTFVRSSGGLGVALTGTVVMGVAIGMGNVAIPVAIGRDFGGRAGPITGVYTASLNSGAMLTSLLTAPLADLVGWRWALAGWGLLGLAAAVLWTTVRGGPLRSVGSLREADPRVEDSAAQAPPTAADSNAGRASSTPMWRRPAAVLLTAAFAGQAFSYYGVTAWLPSLLADERGLSRTSAGLSSSLFQILGIVGAGRAGARAPRSLAPHGVHRHLALLGLPADRTGPGARAGGRSGARSAASPKGAGITTIFILVLHHARSVSDRQRLSTLVQGVGYGIGAAGPTIVGAVHQVTGTWRVPMLVVAVAVVLMAVTGIIAATMPAAHVRA